MKCLRWCHTLAMCAVAVSACTMLAGSAEAQGKTKTSPASPGESAPNAPPQAPGWSVTCENPGQGLSCKATQTIVLAKTRQLLLKISVSKPAENENTTMLLHVPHGIYNPAGVTITVEGEKPETLPIQTCNVQGCYAATVISPARLSVFKQGGKLNVVFQDLNKKEVSVPVPLTGFVEAYQKL